MISITFLAAISPTADPRIAVLHQDVKEQRHFSTYSLAVPTKEIHVEPFSKKVERGAQLMIPLATHLGGGIVIVGEHSIVVFSEAGQQSINIRPSVIRRYNKEILP